jgi:Fic family protein
MIYGTPPLRDEDLAVIEAIDDLARQLRYYLVRPRRWFGTLRRATVARAVQGSNTIEGYHASIEDVAAVLEGEEPLDADIETRHAIAGYRDAMTYVLQLASDPPPLDPSLVKGLHFMMMKYDLTKHPGQWRPGSVWIEDEQGQVVYEAPEREALDGLVAEAFAQANEDAAPAMVRAAMVHLNLTLIHPFSDGNGRMARCLQTYVLASNGAVSPEFSSIEEYLGRNTQAYYEVLTEVAQGRWSPERDARPWLRFCLTAHYRQAQTVLRRVSETEALWDQCEQLVAARRLHSRCVSALCDAARGWRLRRSLYMKVVRSATGEEINDATATRDLRALVDAGLLQPVGEKRARTYEPTPDLRAVWQEIRRLRPPRHDEDPYDLTQPRLPGLA